jgi:hypothetical protein
MRVPLAFVDVCVGAERQETPAAAPCLGERRVERAAVAGALMRDSEYDCTSGAIESAGTFVRSDAMSNRRCTMRAPDRHDPMVWSSGVTASILLQSS